MRRKDRSHQSLLLVLGCSSLLALMMVASGVRAFVPSTFTSITRQLLFTSRRVDGGIGAACYRVGISTFHNHRCSQLRPHASLRLRNFATFNDADAVSNDRRPDGAANDEDNLYMQQAIEHARNGLGHTYPNPAVGCVVVRQGNSSLPGGSGTSDVKVLGNGFHPRAGYPHAEVFALLEAFDHVPDGVAAARSIVQRRRGTWVGSRDNNNNNNNNNDAESDATRLADTVTALTTQYIQGGAQALFGGRRLQGESGGDSDDSRIATATTVTAYVTLEPCCHEGKTTPPCAAALVVAGVDRVVVGFRDPNPRVDGGGVRYLQERGVTVDFCPDARLAQQCQDLVADFCKRITPPFPSYEHVTGAMRSSLRTMAAQRKQAKSLAEVSWGGKTVQLPDDDSDVDAKMAESIDGLVLDPEWMEHLDGQLWRHEVVLMRLNSAVAKKRYVKRLGERIAQQLQAHVAQTAGHTVLLYRPGKPAVLDLEHLVLEKRRAL